jgi:predicted chitinase
VAKKLYDVEMPDGAIISDVPEGTSMDELLKQYNGYSGPPLEEGEPAIPEPETIQEILQEAALKGGITDPAELAQFLAQVTHESGNFKYMEEIWGPTPAQKRYEGRKNLGNTQTGDGHRYRGRGLIQLTGRDNYKTFGEKLGIDLENSPELASEPDTAADLAVEFWNARVKPYIKDFNNTRGVTRRINGGYNGLPDREKQFKTWTEKLNLQNMTLEPTGTTAAVVNSAAETSPVQLEKLLDGTYQDEEGGLFSVKAGEVKPYAP